MIIQYKKKFVRKNIRLKSFTDCLTRENFLALFWRTANFGLIVSIQFPPMTPSVVPPVPSK